ncbi:CPBP family intramembrane glutamic endopeptidase [Halegenticoccus tardaugens]|uniref:CPBP family intramembrane glutamic endopeptidase n=1 Tax=Halegenticoccus tardaugens TaxID=2071624 RepID=UPI00100B84D9|nr:CPBP family intramembrane glutamic endopeptidase [Halegenticoccus tardaugens]
MTTARTERRSLFPTLLALVSGAFVGVFGLALGTVLTLLVGLLLVVGFGVELTAAATIVLALVFTQGIGCGGVALAYPRLRPRAAAFLRARFDSFADARGDFSLPASVPSVRDLLVFVVGYVVAFGLAIVGGIVVSLTGSETGTNQAVALGLENPEVLLLLIPASFLLIGPGEEMLFRGVVQGRIREAFGPVAGIAIASAIFAGIHIFALTGGTPTGNLLSLGVLFFPSVVFGTAYELTDNLVVPSLIHGAYNATLFSLLYAAIKLGSMQPPGAF